MKLIRIYSISFILLFSLSCGAQQADDLINDELLHLERQIFESSDKNTRYQLILQKAFILKENGRPKEALRTLDRIPYQSMAPDVGLETAYNMALLHFAQNQFQDAQRYLSDCYYYFDAAQTDTRVQFLQILIFNVVGDYDDAKELLGELNQHCRKPVNADSAYQEIFSLKNPEKAQRLSAYLPGLGQWYNGNFWRGVNSFLLHAATVTYMIYCGTNKLYLNGIFSGLNLFAAFYSGGKRNAYALSIQKQQYAINQLNAYLINWYYAACFQTEASSE